MKKSVVWITSILILGTVVCGTAIVGADIYGGEFQVTWDSENETYQIDGESQSQITLTRGVTYEFDVNTSGEPFHITTDDTLGNNYSEVYHQGVKIKNGSGTSSATDNGTLVFTVPEEAPDDMYYTSANTKTGSHIIVVDQPPAGEVDDEPIPVLLGSFGIIPYWLIGGLVTMAIATGYLGGREVDEIELFNGD